MKGASPRMRTLVNTLDRIPSELAPILEGKTATEIRHELTARLNQARKDYAAKMTKAR